MKAPRENAGKAGIRLTKKSLFEAPADFTSKQKKAAWEAYLKTQPPIAAQPIPKPEIRMSDELAAKRAKVPPRLSENQTLIGKLPLNLSAGGLDAALWPWIKRWIENPLNKNAGEWRLISDQRRYLCALVNLAMRPNSKEAKAQRAFTDSVAPNFTCRVLPMLRRRLKKLTPKDYVAVTRNPTPEVDEKFSARQHDKRAKLRVGLKSLPKFI